MNRTAIVLLCAVLTLPVFGQYCTATLACACSVPNADEYIANVSLGAINNTTGCTVNPSYSDYTGLGPANLQVGVASPISVTIGNYWSSDDLFVWIDWNGNGSFADAGDLAFTSFNAGPAGSSGASPFTATGSITPPAGAVAATRMRVILRYANTTPAPCPALASSFGEVEDYSVTNFTGPIPCTTFFSSPGGAGTILAQNLACAPLAGAAYFWAFTFAPGTYPNGGWFGLDIGLAQLVNWYQSGYPFTGTLDGAGASSFAAGGLPSGLQFWQVTTMWAPGYGTFLTSYPPVTYTIP